MFQLTIDESFWLSFNIERFIYLDVNLISSGIFLVTLAIFFRAKKVYNTRKVSK